MITLFLLEPASGNLLDVENKKNLLALFVVVKFVVVVGFVSFLIWTIRKNAAKQCPETSDLLDEIEQEETKVDESIPPDEKGSETEMNWERNPDWWKNEAD